MSTDDDDDDDGFVRGIVRRVFGPAAAPLEPLAQHGGADSRPFVLVTLFAASATQARTALGRHGRARSYRPVFVTTSSDVRALLAEGHVLEYMHAPERAAAHRGSGDWPAYTAERWRLINSKWRPAWTAAFGLPFVEYLRKIEKSASFEPNSWGN